MKIYPNAASILVTKEVNPLTDIPLSYVDTNSANYSISTVINEKFKLKETKELFPYDTVNQNYICLFDKLGNQIPYEEALKNFTRQGKDYIYMPFGVKSFTPKRFEYTVTAKKKCKYQSNMHYNINALVYNNKETANNLMPIFGDAPARLIAPANILINNGDLSLESITSSSIQDVDITFIRLKNHDICLEDNYLDQDVAMESEFDKKTYIDCYKTNLFAFYENSFAVSENSTTDTGNQVVLYQKEESEEFKIKTPLIYNSVSLITNKYFNVPVNTEDVVYHNLFNSSKKTPILIEEHVGKAFMIYASEDLLVNVTDYSKIMYEIISWLYFNSYITSETFSDWISDEVPEYIVNNKKLIKKDKFVSNIELYKMFGLSSSEITNCKVNIDETKYPYVKFTGVSMDYLTFEKYKGENNEYADPIEKTSGISLYVQPNIYFYDNFIYKINDSIEECMKVEKIDNEIIINLKPFKHSDSGIYVKSISEPIKIPLTYMLNDTEQQIQNADYYLVSKPNEAVSYFEAINSLVYDESKGEILATIKIRQDASEKLVYDMRQRGGGIPEDEKDNFDCFDIGHIYGRPYRKGGTIIITLPKHLEQHKDLIMATIKQYCVAEEYPILLFKED